VLSVGARGRQQGRDAGGSEQGEDGDQRDQQALALAPPLAGQRAPAAAGLVLVDRRHDATGSR
jgi:hypothetical protein